MSTETTERDETLDAVDNPHVEPFRAYGQAQVDWWPCVLVAGENKPRFDPARHSQDQLRHAVQIVITPVVPGRRAIERDILAESQEWKDIVLASIRALGLKSVADLRNRWVAVEFVPSGRKRDDGTYWQTIKFVALYPDEQACLRAATAGRGPAAAAEYAAKHGRDAAVFPQQSPPAAGTGMSRESALAVLRAYAKSYGSDPAAFLERVAATPALAAHFGPDSPEVLELIGAERAESVPF